MRQVSVDARDKDNWVEQFEVATTILDASIDGGQIGELYERRGGGGGGHTLDQIDDEDGHSALQESRDGPQGDLGSPAGVQSAPHGHGGGRLEPRKISFKGAKQALTAFAPKLEAALPGAMLKAVGYHRVGNRPGRWEPRARKRRPKPTKRLGHPRHIAKLAQNRAKWY
jgi:hypothetical protein